MTTTTTTTTTRMATTPTPTSTKMGINAITHIDGQQQQQQQVFNIRKASEDLLLPSISPRGSLVHPSTPPESTTSGSPRLKIEGNNSPHPPPSASRMTTTTAWTTTSAAATKYAPPPPPSASSSRSRDCSPLPRIADMAARLGSHSHMSPPSSSSLSSPTVTRLPSLEEFDLGVQALARYHGPARPHTPPSPLPSLGLGLMGQGNGYPSPPPDGENRHINQKYTTEEGDFIIYAWHDKKFKWQRIKQDFAAMFGRTPERTVQGLQAWYYRMNQRIPLWNQDGWLIFDNDDELEPKYISIKCRERDSQDKPMEPLGLAQRYPERAIHYSWVDSELKRKAQDWAAKRAMQYRDRRERRKRKEHRRQKL
ncbi:hypothetical protein CP532_1507 [Ophiocordyceps camponoti-leonardi (nom. inval.)]|nr:hypothetical protein CP532_1507 [Ophiocordyceps camponoti-leonardi (nom. inval.)]